MNQAMENNQLNLAYYWNLIRGRLWPVLALTVVVTILAAIYANSIPPTYKATTTILLEPQQAGTVTMADLLYVDTRGATYVNTQKEIIKSRRMIEALIDKLKLEKPSDTAPAAEQQASWLHTLLQQFVTPAETESAAEQQASWLQILLQFTKKAEPNADMRHRMLVRRIVASLELTEIKKSQLIQLSFEHGSAEMSAAMTNTLTDIYIQDTLAARVKMTQQATSWMRNSADSLKVKLASAENALQTYIEREGLVNLGDNVESLAAQELSEYSNRAVSARAKVAELEQRYGPKHPKLVAAKSELNQALYAMRIGKSRILAIGRKSAKLKELQHEVESTRLLHDSILVRVKETGEAGTLKTATARVIDPAIIPLYPIKPKKKLIVIAAFMLSLAAGIGLILLLDMLNATIRSVEEVGAKLGLPLLGLVPLLKFKNKKISRDQIMREMAGGDNHHFSEAIRTIRTGIMLSAIDKPHKTILVTSSLPAEGKSTVATNLAIAFGKMEKVLLMDADMRRPTVRKHIGLETMELGLSELVADTAKLKETICQNEEFGIDVIHAGMIPPNPLELISSKRFSEIMDAFEKHYDRIIIDSTPIQAVSDALVLSQHASGLVYVIKSDTTSEHLIKNCLKRFKEVKAPIIGVVLNQVDVKKKGKYGYGYGGYYDQYGYSSSSSSEKT